MTDNGPCFYADRFRDACRELGLKHIRTRIYTPRTNGKAERFIQTALREWAYAGSTKTPQNETSWLHWLTSTTGIDHMLASTKNRPSAEPASVDVNNLLRHHI